MPRPAGVAELGLDPGSDAGSIHAQAKDDAASATGDNSALIGNLAIRAIADRTAILLTCAPKDGDFRTLFVPLDEQARGGTSGAPPRATSATRACRMAPQRRDNRPSAKTPATGDA